MSRQPLRLAIMEAERVLADAGVASPRYDAETLAAHVVGVERSRLMLQPLVDPAQVEALRELVDRRATREPLQHLLGTAVLGPVTVSVGPGVFTPRPETELLAGWAVDRAREVADAVVVDLCTGSGAIAASVAAEAPRADVHAVELDPAAHAWAQRNLDGTDVDLRLGDMGEAFADLDGAVDVVVCNPPYIPLEAWASVAPEARDHDPALALWSGDDGLEAFRLLERTAARLLKPGGWVGAEHADVQGESAAAVFTASGRWSEVRDHPDLAGRARYVSARLAR